MYACAQGSNTCNDIGGESNKCEIVWNKSPWSTLLGKGNCIYSLSMTEALSSTERMPSFGTWAIYLGLTPVFIAFLLMTFSNLLHSPEPQFPFFKMRYTYLEGCSENWGTWAGV